MAKRRRPVFESTYGNTHIIASNIADGLRASHEVTLVPVARATGAHRHGRSPSRRRADAHAQDVERRLPAVGGRGRPQAGQRADRGPGRGRPGLREWLNGIGESGRRAGWGRWPGQLVSWPWPGSVMSRLSGKNACAPAQLRGWSFGSAASGSGPGRSRTAPGISRWRACPGRSAGWSWWVIARPAGPRGTCRPRPAQVAVQLGQAGLDAGAQRGLVGQAAQRSDDHQQPRRIPGSPAAPATRNPLTCRGTVSRRRHRFAAPAGSGSPAGQKA